MKFNTRNQWPLQLAGILLVTCPVLCLVWPAIIGQQTFVFRDAGHFYYPLYEYVCSEWGSGRIPLWNPYDNLGQPLLANVPSAVFYPVKLIFLLPFDYVVKYNWYIVSHLLVAAATCYWCGRQWGISRQGALLATLSYVLSGSILSQYCNVIYLVGAAWMPLALWAAERMWHGTGSHGYLVWGVSVALMVLGGDPQAAYHAALASVLFAILVYWRDRNAIGATSCFRHDEAVNLSRWRRYLWLASLAVVTGAALSAVQILPSLEWARYSDRSNHMQPHTVWQLAEEISRRVVGTQGKIFTGSEHLGIVGKLPQGTHQAHAYDFSNGPWRFVELVWPNFGGCQYPIHARWLNGLPAEGRIWTPSLYIGILPLVMAAATWTRRKLHTRVHWLWVLVILFGLASLGRYGVGWLLNEIIYLANGGKQPDPIVGQPVGGIYWWMFILLPGYSVFRYPAKLFAVATLGLSLLAGFGWDSKRWQNEMVRRLFVWIASFTFVLFVVAILLISYGEHLFRDHVPADVVFGPFDWQASCWDMVVSLVQTLVLCGIYLVIMKYNLLVGPDSLVNSERRLLNPVSGARWQWSTVSTSGWALLLLTALELVFAHHWMMQFAPSTLWQSPTALSATATQIEQPLFSGTRWFRSSNSSQYPPEWRFTSSRDRHVEALRWDRETVYPNFHLQYPLRQTGIFGAAMPGDFRFLWSLLQRRNLPDWHTESWLDALAVNHFMMLDTTDRMSLSTKLASSTLEVGHSHTVCWLYRPQELERAWAVPLDQVDWVSTENMVVPRATDKLLDRVIESRSNHCSYRENPVLFGTADDVVPGVLSAAQQTRGNARVGHANQVQIIRDEPNCVVLQTDLSEPCLVVLADQFYPGWNLQVAMDGSEDFRRAPLLRTNLVMRGAVLPRGRQTLSFEYRPKLFVVGAVISGLSWLALITGIGFRVSGRLGLRRNQAISAHSDC